MKTKIWEFEAIDTLFFGDSLPNNAGEGGGLGIESIFPPFMFTLQGAVRTGLALGQGWTPTGRIPFPDELGDSDFLGDISFEGPYLKYGEDFLFPVPLNLLNKDLEKIYRLVPQEKAYHTDMGKVRLPVLKEAIRGAKTMNNYLVKKDVLNNILCGEEINLDKKSFIDKRRLWNEEERVGIGIDKLTGTAEQGMLYITSHIRPEGDLFSRYKLSIVVKVKGIREEWHNNVPKVLSLGGEGRMAKMKISNNENILPPMPKFGLKKDIIKFTVTLVTPGRITHPMSESSMKKEMEDLIKGGYKHIPGNCVSACIGKIMQVGGFDIKKREPRPLIPLIPGGSTWFYEGEAKEFENLQKLHGKTKDPLGFNQIIIGKWGD